MTSNLINQRRPVILEEMEDTKPEETNVEEQKVSILEDSEIKPLQSVRFQLFRCVTVFTHSAESDRSEDTSNKMRLSQKPAVKSMMDVMIVLCSVWLVYMNVV